MTWKVRGRSSSQTPEPARTPMASETMSSITRLPRRDGRRGCRAAGRRGGAVAADGLVGQRDQHQQRRADDQGEDAEVEEERARRSAPRR